MSLEYRSGHWNVIYRPDGRYGRKVRHPVPTAIQEVSAAQVFHDNFIKDWKKSVSRELNPRPMTGLTISRLWDEYLPWYQMHRAETTYRDVKNVGKWIKAYIGKFAAESFSGHHLNVYKHMRKQGAQSKNPSGLNCTINKECAYLCGFVRWAARNGHITSRTLIWDKLPYNRPIPRILTIEEVHKIIKAADPFYRAWILCLYSLGLRLDEARQLKWQDIDRENNTVTVKQKGGTFKRLPLSPALALSFDEIPVNDPQGGETDYVFYNPATKKPVQNIGKAIDRICAKAGINRHVNAHLFRHSIACHLMSENVNVSLIQNLLGHAQLQTTQRYSHVTAANLRGVESVISRLLK